MLKYNAILFDVDGTLIDSAPGILHTLEEVFHTMGVDTTNVNLRRYLGPPLRKSFGEHEVLHDVTAGVERGDRIGIIGANGTGKTTLLRILCGESLPDAGDAAFGTGVTTGYLEQNARLDPAFDVYATMKLVFTPALDAMQQMEGLQKQLAADPHNAELTDKIAHCTAVVDAMDAYVQSQQKSMEHYLEDQYQIASAARVATVPTGEVVMVCCEDSDTVFENIKKALAA